MSSLLGMLAARLTLVPRNTSESDSGLCWMHTSVSHSTCTSAFSKKKSGYIRREPAHRACLPSRRHRAPCPALVVSHACGAVHGPDSVQCRAAGPRTWTFWPEEERRVKLLRRFTIHEDARDELKRRRSNPQCRPLYRLTSQLLYNPLELHQVPPPRKRRSVVVLGLNLPLNLLTNVLAVPIHLFLLLPLRHILLRDHL
jgi:hypothetical protein